MTEKELAFVKGVLLECHELLSWCIPIARGRQDLDTLETMNTALGQAFQIVEKAQFNRVPWLPGDIACLNWLYGTQVLKDASPEAYGESNQKIGEVAGVPVSEVEQWITGEGEPTPEQGGRLGDWLTSWALEVGNDPEVPEAVADSIEK